MKGLHLNVAIGVLIAAASIAPTQAQSLLGGGDGSGGLVSVDSGSAGSSSLVNIGLGGGGGNVLDANIGSGSQPLASANVSSGGSSGQTLGVDANVGGSLANASVGVGGTQGVGIGLDVLDGTVSTTATIGGGGSSGGNNNNNNNPGGRTGGQDTMGNTNGNGRGGVLIGSQDAGGVSALPGCTGVSARQLQQLVNSTRVNSSWSRAANVEVRPVPLCPEQAAWLRNTLRSQGIDRALQRAVINDALISASLSRTRYSADDVIAVNQSGGRLTVYVN